MLALVHVGPRRLTALSAAIALVYLVHPAWAYSLANGSSRLLDEFSHELAVDLVRLFPSMVRWRPATWIVPLALTLAQRVRVGRRDVDLDQLTDQLVRPAEVDDAVALGAAHQLRCFGAGFA